MVEKKNGTLLDWVQRRFGATDIKDMQIDVGLACTEVENQWRAILDKTGYTPQNGRTYTTQDYSKLIGKIFLEEFSINLRNMTFSDVLQPFDGWDTASPTQSLVWYDAYNKTKHNRETNFNCATLRHVIEAISANIVLYSVRFSPLVLINNSNNFSSLINQMFQIQMENSAIDSFYLPDIDTSRITRTDCFVIDSYK